MYAIVVTLEKMVMNVSVTTLEGDVESEGYTRSLPRY